MYGVMPQVAKQCSTYSDNESKAADKFYDQAAGQQSKEVQEFAQEHTGMGCFEVETEKMQMIASPCISTACNSVHKPLQGKELDKLAGQGFEPRLNGSEPFVLPLHHPAKDFRYSRIK